MSEQPEPLIIDVDTGIDDAFALLHACAQAPAQILGVSTVVGNVSLAAATRNTRAVLALAGRADIPVWPGAATAISNAVRDASEIHGQTGLGHAVLPEPEDPRQASHAADSIIGAARSHSGRLVLCAVGPLTNIALAVMREPELPRLVKRFVIMGGAYAEPGNVTPSAEFNIWHDPEAARIVFRAFGGVGAAPVIAIGLDVTRKTIIDERDIAAIGSRIAGKPHGAKLARFLEDASRFYFERMEKMLGKRIFTMHDPLAVAVALDSDAGRNAPRGRRCRDHGAPDDRRHDRRLARPVGPPRQQRGRRRRRRRALPRSLLRRDGAPGRGPGGEEDLRSLDREIGEDARPLRARTRAKAWRLSSCPLSFYLCSSDYSREGTRSGALIRLEPRFAELAATTNFSFLRGASHPEEMVARAAELGLAGIGIADRNTLAGIVRAHTFARENAEAMGAMRVVPGARLAFVDGAPDALVYPKDRAAYGRLCRILTEGNRRAPKGECWLKLDDLLERSEGLQVVAMPASPHPSPSAAPPGQKPGGEGTRPSAACARPSASVCGSARASPMARTCAARWRGGLRLRAQFERR